MNTLTHALSMKRAAVTSPPYRHCLRRPAPAAPPPARPRRAAAHAAPRRQTPPGPRSPCRSPTRSRLAARQSSRCSRDRIRIVWDCTRDRSHTDRLASSSTATRAHPPPRANATRPGRGDGRAAPRYRTAVGRTFTLGIPNNRTRRSVARTHARDASPSLGAAPTALAHTVRYSK